MKASMIGSMTPRERFLSAATESEELRGMRENLRAMHAFYTLMESFYSDFSARWRDERSRLDIDPQSPTT